MTWQLTRDRDEFVRATWSSLVDQPVRNTALLSALAADHGPDDLLFAWCPDSAALVLPRGEVRTSELPEQAATSLAKALSDRGCHVTAVQGPAQAAHDLATAWAAHSGTRASVALAQRLYTLSTLNAPSPRPGEHARTAIHGDRDLLLTWYGAYMVEVGLPGDPTRTTDNLLASGGALLWIVQDTPVAFAAHAPPAVGVARVFGVYTPPELRGHGYGSAVTAAVTDKISQGGHQAALFTDLANPTSNAIYQRLGYQPVGDYTLYRV
jgi:predicted GNAT family acetyltransferase